MSDFKSFYKRSDWMEGRTEKSLRYASSWHIVKNTEAHIIYPSAIFYINL
jgi:hypothetical protein